MNRPSLSLLLISLAGIFLSLAGRGIAQDDAKKADSPPIKALLVTGGCSHDYSTRKDIIVRGIRERTKRQIEWKVHHEGEGESDVRIPLFESPVWAEGYDIVVHDYCFPRITDEGYIDRILAPHRAGLPAVLIHGAMHSFRGGDDRWFDFCGVTSRGHERDHALVVEPLAKEHPILKGMVPWPIPHGQLYRVEKLHPGVTVLTHSASSTGEKQVNTWTHLYGPGKARVFATTIGNETSTLLTPSYLDLIARGFLWALDDLSDENFLTIPPDQSLRGVSLPDPGIVMPGPGPNKASGGLASALTVSAGWETGPGKAIDGNPLTFWDAEVAGPSSWQVTLARREWIGAVAVTWKGPAPGSYLLEGSEDLRAWQTLAAVAGSTDLSPQTVIEAEPLRVRHLRLSIPETPPGIVPGIREFGAYGSLEDVPSAYFENTPPKPLRSPALLTAGRSGFSRKLRLAPGWSVGASVTLPSEASPLQLIPTAQGKAFVLAESGDRAPRRSVFSVTPQPDGSMKLSEFLKSLDPTSVIAWDGEWLYTLSDGSLNAFRDTEGDGSADERFRRGQVFTLPTSATSRDLMFSQLRLGLDGWFYALVAAREGLTVLNSYREPIVLPRNGLVRFRRNGSGFEVILRTPEPLDDFRWESGGAMSLHRSGRGDETGRTAVTLAPPLSDSRGNASLTLPWPPSESGDSRWSGIKQVVSGDRVYFRTEPDSGECGAGTAGIQLVAQVDGLVKVEDDGQRFWIAASDPGTSTVATLIRSGGATGSGVEWDDLRAADLVSFLKAKNPTVRREAVFEILRRKWNPVPDLEALLAGNPSTELAEGILSALAAVNDRRAIAVLLRVASSEYPANQVLAFHLLGDYPGMTNHPVFGELTKSTDPEVTGGILAAMLRSGTDMQGLESLALSFTAHPDLRLAATARAFLIAREASPDCFEALDDPAREGDWHGALDVLSAMYRPTVVEGIVLRLEQTGSPRLRRLGIEALCRLYYFEGVRGRIWEGTRIADLFLRASMHDHRVDRPALLNAMQAAGIPFPEPEALAALAGESIPLEAFAIDVLLGTRGPFSSETLDWLAKIAASENRDGDLRLRAISLFVQHSGPDDYHRSFNETARRETIPSLLGSATMVLDRWLSRSDHPANIPWLTEQARGSNDAKGRLAWETLLPLVDRPASAKTDQEKISAAVMEAKGAGGDQFLRLIEALPGKGFSGTGAILSEGHRSESEAVRGAAAARAAAFSIDPASGLPLGAKLGEMAVGDIVEQVKAETAATVDGRALFRKLACDICHNIHGEGFAAGPDLALAMKSLTTEALIEAILTPSKKISPGFETYLFEMKDGRRLRGHIENRDDTVITARDKAGNLFKVPVAGIRFESPDGGTITNCDAAAALSVKEFAALLHYLRSLSAYP